MKKNVHFNSMEAYHMGRHELFSRRQRAILGALEDIGSGSDREICNHLKLPDMNAVRPRITEMIDAGLLEEVGNTADPITNRTVRVVAIKTAKLTQATLL